MPGRFCLNPRSSDFLVKYIRCVSPGSAFGVPGRTCLNPRIGFSYVYDILTPLVYEGDRHRLPESGLIGSHQMLSSCIWLHRTREPTLHFSVEGPQLDSNLHTRTH